jgi:hypothetical protein
MMVSPRLRVAAFHVVVSRTPSGRADVSAIRTDAAVSVKAVASCGVSIKPVEVAGWSSAGAAPTAQIAAATNPITTIQNAVILYNMTAPIEKDNRRHQGGAINHRDSQWAINQPARAMK